jgi:hypothetical protein
MSRLTITSVVVGAALLSAVPFSLRFSPENSVSLAMDAANAVIGRPLTPLSIAGLHRRAMRRGSYGYGGGYYPYRSYGYGYGSYSAYQSNTYGYHPYRITGSWNSYSSTWYSHTGRTAATAPQRTTRGAPMVPQRTARFRGAGIAPQRTTRIDAVSPPR